MSTATNDHTYSTDPAERLPLLFAILIGLVAVLASCGTSSSDDATSSASTTTSAPPATSTTVSRPTADADEMIAIDSGRLHLRCVGRGPRTVLLLAGWGDKGDGWGAIEPTLSKQARMCSYSRLGTGISDKPTSNQTFTTWASDLHDVLEAAGEPGPYVVVGHSFGGPEAVTFASRYPKETDGLLLLDGTIATWPEAICAVPSDGTEAARALNDLCGVMRDPAKDPERLDSFPAFAEAAEITSLGNLPMTVMSADHRATPPGLAPHEVERLNAAWEQGVKDWADLSTASTVVTVSDTGHYIQIDQPARVIREIQKLL